MENVPPQTGGGGGMIVLMIVLFCCVMTAVGGAAWYYGYIPGTDRNIIRKSKIQEIDNDVDKLQRDPKTGDIIPTFDNIKKFGKICEKVRRNKENLVKTKDIPKSSFPLWFTLRHGRTTPRLIDSCEKVPTYADFVNFESYVGTIDNMKPDFENVDAESSTCRQFKEYSTDENTPWFSRVDHGLEESTLRALGEKCTPSSDDN